MPLEQEPKNINTTFVATTTHTKINGETYAVRSLPEQFGFSYEERRDALALNHQLHTFCKAGGVSLTLAMFEEIHPNIVLGTD